MFYSRCSTVNTAALENGVKAVIKGVIYITKKKTYIGDLTISGGIGGDDCILHTGGRWFDCLVT